MSIEKRWLLPSGIEEILPAKAQRLELLCRHIIDLYVSWGYELVFPPMIEYLDSLLTGTGEDLDLQTFKMIDQLSGRMLGIRADMTPQVARIDAHVLKRDVPTRLCYLGSVLHTRSTAPTGTRAPLQIGAELYGHAGLASDIEILVLMLETLRLSAIKDIYIDIGHVGIYQSLVAMSNLDIKQQDLVFDALKRKAKHELSSMLDEWKVAPTLYDALLCLIDLNGDSGILKEAKKLIGGISKDIMYCLEELDQVQRHVEKELYDNSIVINYDLGELRGYRYHTGIIFTAYNSGYGEGIAFGGRYNDIGAAFGRARPAVGFSADVRILLSLCANKDPSLAVIYAPYVDDKKLTEKINMLRKQGTIVVRALPGQIGGAAEMKCSHTLEKEGEDWVVSAI